MSACDSFRTRFHVATEDAALLGHLRTCDRCLDFAAAVDPDVMFRALGGSDMIPPGGVDAFVDDVMRQVRVRDAEQSLQPRNVVSWPRRLAVAATIAAAVIGGTLVYRVERGPASPQPAAVVAATGGLTARPVALVTKPIIETYDSQNATIVEVPSEETDDVKIVMVFDENLPADL
jgi:hypothetical protein